MLFYLVRVSILYESKIFVVGGIYERLKSGKTLKYRDTKKYVYFLNVNAIVNDNFRYYKYGNNQSQGPLCLLLSSFLKCTYKSFQHCY